MDCTDPLRVGYVLKRYPRFSETFVVHEILAHERAGLAVEIFALGPVDESHFQDAIGRVRAPVTRLSDVCRHGRTMWSLIDRARRELPAFWPALNRLEPEDPDVLAQGIELALAAQARGLAHLHAHFGTRATAVARLAAAFAGIGYSFTAHAKDIYHPYAEPQALDAKLRDAAFALTVSDYNLAHLRQRFGAADTRRLHRLYNGLALGELRHGEAPAAAAAPEAAVTAPAAPAAAPAGSPRGREIVSVGRLVEKKGLRVLIEAARLLAARGVDFHCTLIGDGPLAGELQAQVAHSGVGAQVTLLGAQAQPVVLAAMRGAAVFAAPCVVAENGDRDGLPTVLLEAMALGTPCVSTRVAGIPELVVDGESGLCVPPDDPDALADALQRLLDDPALQQRLAAAARARVERDFDIDRNTAVQRLLFERAVRGLPLETVEGRAPTPAASTLADPAVAPVAAPSAPVPPAHALGALPAGAA